MTAGALEHQYGVRLEYQRGQWLVGCRRCFPLCATIESGADADAVIWLIPFIYRETECETLEEVEALLRQALASEALRYGGKE